MASLPSAAEINALASILAPGLIISAIRVRAITGSYPDLKDGVLTYGIISVAYFAAISPLFHVEAGISVPHWLWGLLQYVIVPFIIGIASAYTYQYKLIYRGAAQFGLRMVHHRRAAWDFMFEDLKPCFVLVTLHDGAQIAGRWDHGSFASSGKDERDLLLTEIYDVKGVSKQWTALIPPRSILICGKDIRHIEFLGD